MHPGTRPACGQLSMPLIPGNAPCLLPTAATSQRLLAVRAARAGARRRAEARSRGGRAWRRCRRARRAGLSLRWPGSGASERLNRSPKLRGRWVAQRSCVACICVFALGLVQISLLCQTRTAAWHRKAVCGRTKGKIANPENKAESPQGSSFTECSVIYSLTHATLRTPHACALAGR